MTRGATRRGGGICAAVPCEAGIRCAVRSGDSMIRRTFLAGLAAGASLPLVGGAFAQEDDVLSRDAVLRDPDIPVLGNPNGDVSVVEFFDYQCPYCKSAAPELMKVVQEDGKVRFVMKDWPVFGAASVYAAKIVLAAQHQRKYAAAHKAVMAARGKLSETLVDDVLRKAGIDLARAKTDAGTHDATLTAVLKRNNAQAEAFGFQGTPSFIVGTFRVPGVLSADNLKRAIADARKVAKS